MGLSSIGIKALIDDDNLAEIDRLSAGSYFLQLSAQGLIASFYSHFALGGRVWAKKGSLE